jgi:hypothetical protein
METTLNIRKDILKQVAEAAESHGMSCSEMIVLLINRSTREIANPECPGRRVQYQARRKPADWSDLHVKLREDEYEYWLDIRKLMKMSVSLILGNAVRKFLSKPFKINSTDNYLCKNYIIAKEIIDNITIWKFIWGFPPNLGKAINFNT